MLAESFIGMKFSAPYKLCSAFLDSNRKYLEYLGNFIAAFKSIDEMEKNKTEYLEQQIKNSGFEKHRMSSTHGL